MIEVNVLLEPSFSDRFVNFNHSCVDGLKVLQSSHVTDESMGWLGDWCISFEDSKREPDMLDFWIISISNVQVSIDLSKEFTCQSMLLGREFRAEYLLDVTRRIIVEVYIILSDGNNSIDVLIG